MIRIPLVLLVQLARFLHHCWKEFESLDSTNPRITLQSFVRSHFIHKLAVICVVKINKELFSVEEDKTMDDVTLEDLADELPDTQPRYVILSYKYETTEGRVSYPLVFLYWTPSGILLQPS